MAMDNYHAPGSDTLAVPDAGRHRDHGRDLHRRSRSIHAVRTLELAPREELLCTDGSTDEDHEGRYEKDAVYGLDRSDTKYEPNASHAVTAANAGHVPHAEHAHALAITPRVTIWRLAVKGSVTTPSTGVEMVNGYGCGSHGCRR